jgi:hypothetical protein
MSKPAKASDASDDDDEDEYQNKKSYKVSWDLELVFTEFLILSFLKTCKDSRRDLDRGRR